LPGIAGDPEAGASQERERIMYHQLDILLVEDDRCCEELALRALRKGGFDRVSVARDGLEALSMLYAGSEEGGGAAAPGVVLLDLKLPRLDGIHVLQRIRDDERTREVKVFALSASEDPDEIEKCLSLGAVAVLPKPLDPQVLEQWLAAPSAGLGGL
jgi:two-component system response regulator